MNILKRLTILFCLLPALTCESVASVFWLNSPSGQKVFLLGDYHDALFMPFLERFISSVKRRTWSHPLTLVLELSPVSLETETCMAPTIMRLIQEWGKPNSEITIKLLDPRKYESDCLELARSEIFKLLCSEIPHSAIDEHYSAPAKTLDESSHEKEKAGKGADEWGSYRRGKRSSDFATSAGPTVKEYLAVLDKQRREIAMLIDKFEDLRVKQLFRERYQNFDQAYKRIEADLKSYGNESFMMQSIFDLFLQCSTNRKALGRFDSFFQDYYLATDYNYYEAVVIDSILSQKGTDLRCYYIGDTHAKRIAASLAAHLNWETESFTHITQVSTLVMNVSVDTDSTMEFLLEGMIEFLHSQTEKRCDGCSDVFEKLKFCARCTQAYYCGAACQKQHWSNIHKLECGQKCSLSRYAEKISC